MDNVVEQMLNKYDIKNTVYGRVLFIRNASFYK